MKSSLTPLVLVCATLWVIASCAKKSTDQESIQGVWLAQSESQNGLKKKVTYQYVFRGDMVNFKDENGIEIRYSFKLDTASNPKLCIIQPQGTLSNSKPVSVAYELNGDSLKIVVAPPGSVPTEITDKNNQELIICKRKSP